jgi:glycosyltransferase involved in cell wall biosynthesis
MTPRVSIVTTVYDRVACLRRCIRSVQHLAYRDVEHLIVSDAPPYDVVTEIGVLTAAAGLRYVDLPARTNDWGCTPALAGLRAAGGDFVCFLSDDNAYLPDHFGPLVAALDADPGLGFVYASCQYAGRKLLDAPKPGAAQIDLGQPLFRREVLLAALGDDWPPFGRAFAWDWSMIERLLDQGVRWQHIDVASFIFRLEAYPQHLEALA